MDNISLKPTTLEHTESEKIQELASVALTNPLAQRTTNFTKTGIYSFLAWLNIEYFL